MKYKPRFHILFYIYLLFGGIFLGILYYTLFFKLGEKTELNYINAFKAELHDTIVGISRLPSKDYAYFHSGVVNTIELKNDKDISIALYLDSYENENNISIGSCFIKEMNSNIVLIRSSTQEFKISLKNLTERRIQQQKIEAIKLIIIYLILGFIVMFIPLKSTYKKGN